GQRFLQPVRGPGRIGFSQEKKSPDRNFLRMGWPRLLLEPVPLSSRAPLGDPGHEVGPFQFLPAPRCPPVADNVAPRAPLPRPSHAVVSIFASSFREKCR